MALLTAVATISSLSDSGIVLTDASPAPPQSPSMTLNSRLGNLRPNCTGWPVPGRKTAALSVSPDSVDPAHDTLSLEQSQANVVPFSVRSRRCGGLPQTGHLRRSACNWSSVIQFRTSALPALTPRRD